MTVMKTVQVKERRRDRLPNGPSAERGGHGERRSERRFKSELF